MIMAGCLNQAKRIVQMYDNVLHGGTPEVLVQSTHRDIRELLQSDECVEFINSRDEAGEPDDGKGDDFVKKIVQAVAPIVPITLRDKALDGAEPTYPRHFIC